MMRKTQPMTSIAEPGNLGLPFFVLTTQSGQAKSLHYPVATTIIRQVAKTIIRHVATSDAAAILH